MISTRAKQTDDRKQVMTTFIDRKNEVCYDSFHGIKTTALRNSVPKNLHTEHKMWLLNLKSWGNLERLITKENQIRFLEGQGELMQNAKQNYEKEEIWAQR